MREIDEAKDMVIAFIGTGVMGKGMVRNLLSEGYRVLVYNRTKTKADELAEDGAEWVSSPAKAASEAHVVITMVGFPKDVEDLYLAPGGILEHARKGSCLIDMTTSSPLLANRIYEEGKKKSIDALDAPVSGGDIGAREGNLSIMVGGDSSVFERVKPVLGAMGSQIVYQGKSGSGQHTKMCNQIAIATNMIGVCEALIYARKADLNPERLLQSIANGAAGSWSLHHLAPKMMKGNDEPGFFIKHFVKDMGIALESAKEMGLDLPGLQLAKEMYDKLLEAGYGEKGTQALYHWYT